MPPHIIQRGLIRCASFPDDDDRRHLRLLGESAASHDLQIHVGVLLGNHASPGFQG